MKKQTALEWYHTKLAEPTTQAKDVNTIFLLAKEMEKEQIQDAYYHGIWLDESKVHSPYIAAEDYYTSTYGL
jgi:hypothetical protein